jgi:hypothetical protein
VVVMVMMVVVMRGKSSRSSYRNEEKCNNQNLFHVPNPSTIFRPVGHTNCAAPKLQMGHK